jgi:electron transfer flavoprotein beta subunit
MKLAVCLKAVPDTTTKIQIASDSKQIELNGVRFITSPYDEFALEEALRIKEKFGGEVIAYSLGGTQATDVLRDSLARGADDAVHIDYGGAESSTPLTPLSTAKILAAAMREHGLDVVFCGQQGVGSDNSIVPGMLAQLLDLPQVTLVTKLEIESATFKAEREIEGAHELVEGKLPALFSAQKGLNEPRYPSIKGVMASRKKEIKVVTPESLGISQEVIDREHKKMQLIELALPPARPASKMVEGDASQQAAALAQLLRSEAKVI